MRYLICLLCTIGVLTSLSSCYYDNPVIEIEDVSFNDDLIPIFETSCLAELVKLFNTKLALIQSLFSRQIYSSANRHRLDLNNSLLVHFQNVQN